MKPGEIVTEFEAKDGRHVVLRTLKRSDLDRLLTFANVFVKEKRANKNLGVISFDKKVTREGERKWLRGIITGVRRKEIVSVAALVGGKVVGHCDVHRRILSDIHHTGVLGIAILDGYRGVGIGERLMAEALREARKIGLWLVELQVFAVNDAAIHLYEKMGFKRVGVIPNKMRRGKRYYDEVVMFTDLRGSDKSPSKGRRKS